MSNLRNREKLNGTTHSFVRIDMRAQYVSQAEIEALPLSGHVYKVFSDPNLIYIQDNCVTQTRYNAMRGRWASVLEGGGRIAVGSLGLGLPGLPGTDDSPWFEYGGQGFEKVHQFRSSPFTKEGQWDAHAWLEDRDGNVWDIISPYLKTVAKLRNKQLDAGLSIFSGKSKSDCARLGFHYIATDRVTSEILAQLMVPFNESDLNIIDMIRL